MGNHNGKPSDQLKQIDRRVEYLRSSILLSKRSNSKASQEQIVRDLTKLSSDANSLHGRVKQKHLDLIQKKISQAVTDAFQEIPLDQGAVETNSFIQMPFTKTKSNNNTLEDSVKKTRTVPALAIEKTLPTLQDIEQKMKTLKPQIKIALDTGDYRQLKIHLQMLKVLATDLEMIEIQTETPLGDEKKKLEKSVHSQYRKVDKAMQEIRRNKDLNFLTKRSKKDQVMKELEKIKGELEAADEALRQSLRNENYDSLGEINNYLERINQSLISVENVDEDADSFKMQMVDKISWLHRYINDINSRKGSQSDLTKAQTNYEDIIKNIARGKNKDRDETKVKLESLHSFVSNIDNEDEGSMKRQEQLLNNINHSLNSITENESKVRQKSNTIDNSKLQYITTDTDCKKDIEELSILWKTIENNMASSKLSKKEASNVMRILEDLQNSIDKTRRMIEGNDVSNLKHKLNNSTPNLSVNPTIHSKFLSSLSVDQSSSVIRTKAKIYNTSIPETGNVNNQPVELRSKAKSPSLDDNRLSEIQGIKTQVNYIKEKIGNNQNNTHLKNKLESYQTILEDCMSHPNQSTINSAKTVLLEVQDILKQFPNELNLKKVRKLSIEETLENIVAVQEFIDELEKTVDNFVGNKNDGVYKATKDKLSSAKDYLEIIELPTKYAIVGQQKNEILRKVQYLLETLEGKSNNTYREDKIVVQARKSLHNLKDKVNRFTGAYKGVLYNQIEKDLNKLLIDTSQNIRSKQIADQVIKDTEKHLKILEHRATKDQSFRQNIRVSPKDGDEKIINFRFELQTIKRDIDTAPIRAVDVFIALKSRLDLVKLGLDQIKGSSEDEEQQKHVLFNEVYTLKNVVEARIALSQQSIQQWPLGEEPKRETEKKDNKAQSELSQIEDILKKLKSGIDVFVGTTSDEKFYELDETSIRLIIKMDDLKFPKGSDLHHRKLALLKEIHTNSELLDKRAKETEDLLQFERDVQDIETNYDRYSVSSKDLEKLVERIQIMQATLISTNVNMELRRRKQACLTKINEILNRITGTSDGTPKFADHEKLAQLKLDLQQIKKDIDDNPSNRINSLIALKSRLDLVKLGLDQLKNLKENNEQQKEFLYTEIESMTHIVDSKLIVAVRQSVSIEEDKTQYSSIGRSAADFNKIEAALMKIKSEVQTFVGIKSDNNFAEIEEASTKLALKLDSMQFQKGSESYNRKSKLLKGIHQDLEQLHMRAKQTKDLINLEKDIGDVVKKFDKYTTPGNYEKVSKKVAAIKQNLETNQFNSHLEARRQQCIQKVSDMSRIIRDKINGNNDALEATQRRDEIDLLRQRIFDIPDDQCPDLDEIYLKICYLESEIENKRYANKEVFLTDLLSCKEALDKKAVISRPYRELMEKLENINIELDRANSLESLDTLVAQLKFLQGNIEKLNVNDKLKNEAHKKCIILSEKYSRKLKELPAKNYIGSMAFIADIEKNTVKETSEDTIDVKIKEMELELQKLGAKVSVFADSEESDAYKHLDNRLLRLSDKLKRVNVPKDHPWYRKKQECKQKVVECLTNLDDRCQEFDSILDIEKELEDVSRRVEQCTEEECRNILDEQLISLQVKIGKLQVSDILIQRRNMSLNKLHLCMKQLKEKVTISNSDNDEDMGTSV